MGRPCGFCGCRSLSRGFSTLRGGLRFWPVCFYKPAKEHSDLAATDMELSIRAGLDAQVS